MQERPSPQTNTSAEFADLQFFAEPAQVITHPRGRVVLIGQCLSDQDSLRKAAGQVFECANFELLNNLPGTYTSIVSQPDRTVITPDISGQFPIYWQSSDNKVRLSTTASSLGDQVNPTYLAATIACSGTPLVHQQSAYAGVHTVEAGQTLHIRNGQTEIRSSEIAVDPSGNLSEVVRSLREALIEAIELRAALGRCATSDFSGGLDSTSIALLYAQRAETLDVFFYYHPDLAAGDMAFARAFAKSAHNLRLHELAASDVELPFQKLENVDMHDEPDPASAINARIRMRLVAAKSVGSQLHLTGDGGDAVLDVPPNYLLDLAREGKEEQLRASGYALARVRYHSPSQLIAAAKRYSTATLSEDLQTLAKQLRGAAPPPASLTWLQWPRQTALSWLRPQMREQLAEQAARQADNLEVPENMGMADYVALTALRSSGVVHRHLREVANSLGFATHAPLMDNKVVKACLSVPATERANPGRFKQILREAFEGILPTDLLSRASKGSYSKEQYRGLRLSRRALSSLLDESYLADMGIIDPKPIKEEMRRLCTGQRGEFPALDRVIAAELWLRGRVT